ncbi:MAG TPA: hypothetical protein DEG17_00560 [Cyanobacteria bacterium UBA11149]|nr:hypothetical protein [Cyanobacteria bacterium UBA11367]HBE59535.1 hypothetical protein [Cyanobacteria bacterium UBA11366]HBK63867.1 hypothetical protein [Cyanobacteria bacterium UBA11166]HBR75584.1 hypothetical protein [Cyanobacteria bacterium UBA11159]HBS68575.1 hypothetical protein [Cyanobacteria bacterium UBA11153]HBW87409.1 hypothetical protein [Cyanobacteria bacterium UBA11149]HCA93487.1 hypothetical protein [Cyanobacteria bacterium UBA9226]
MKINMKVADLIDRCRNGSDEEKCYAVVALEEMGAKESVPILLELLDFPDEGVRANVASALGKLGNQDVGEKLLILLEDSDPLVRIEAVESLGLLQYLDAIPAIVSKLKTDEDSLVRLCAAEALGNIADVKTLPSLLEALNDGDEGVRAYSADAIGNLGVVEALPILRQKLDAESSRLTKTFILASLYKLGDEASLLSLVKLLEIADYNLAVTIFNLTRELANQQNANYLIETIQEITKSRPSLDPNKPFYPNVTGIIKYLESFRLTEKESVP